MRGDLCFCLLEKDGSYLVLETQSCGWPEGINLLGEKPPSLFRPCPWVLKGQSS